MEREPRALALGDGFDILELLIPDQFASFVVRTFGRLSKPEAYPMGELREIRDRHTTPASVADRIQGDADGRPVAPNLSVVVIGHSHHARMVVDREAGLVLMDCGGWVENHRSGAEVRPNRQIGAICGPDLRIYQID